MSTIWKSLKTSIKTWFTFPSQSFKLTAKINPQPINRDSTTKWCFKAPKQANKWNLKTKNWISCTNNRKSWNPLNSTINMLKSCINKTTQSNKYKLVKKRACSCKMTTWKLLTEMKGFIFSQLKWAAYLKRTENNFLRHFSVEKTTDSECKLRTGKKIIHMKLKSCVIWFRIMNPTWLGS